MASNSPAATRTTERGARCRSGPRELRSCRPSSPDDVVAYRAAPIGRHTAPGGSTEPARPTSVPSRHAGHRRGKEVQTMKVATTVTLLMLCAAFSPLPGDAAWCTKVTTLNGLAERFPGNHDPDIVVRVDLGERIQDAIDTATDLNGDGYIIVAAVNSGSGSPYGTTAQRIVVDRVYPLPFGLFGCSLSLRDPAPSRRSADGPHHRGCRGARLVRDGPSRDRQRRGGLEGGGQRPLPAQCLCQGQRDRLLVHRRRQHAP